MQDLFAGSGIAAGDFLSLSLYFLMTMTAFFLLKEAKHRRLNWLFLAAFVFYWLLIVASVRPLETKVFATLLLGSIALIELAVSKRRRGGEESRLRKI
ncbi:MAG: hypothetical protein JOZ96_01055 [Acidobacteria bacterium]|nr:hypothetical protein [Acidobacteriota bacterium]